MLADNRTCYGKDTIKFDNANASEVIGLLEQKGYAGLTQIESLGDVYATEDYEKINTFVSVDGNRKELAFSYFSSEAQEKNQENIEILEKILNPNGKEFF